MPYTFANLKRELRQQIWPAGEARNQFVAHNASFIQCLVDLQTWVECLQIDNTQLIPHCATFFKCGLTWFDAPRGIINQLSTIEKIDDEGEPDPEGEDDWCKEIPYTQVNHCHIKQYLTRSGLVGCCTNLPLFFALPVALCGKGNVPIPTDEGLPDGLPILPLGNNYPQESTDAENRARSGVWALERGKIWVAPWIQSTETIVLKWDGIKRDWTDGDWVSEDPKFKRAVECYVRMDHARKFEKNEPEARMWEQQYNVALSDLIHDCRQETMVRACRDSKARGSNPQTALFYNDEQQYTASCPANQEGDPVTVTIPADTVGSTISKSDANAKALEQARTQAQAQLVCEDIPVTYFNTPQTYTATCDAVEDHPLPDGNPVTVTIPAGTFSSQVSQSAADALALAAAQQQAEDLLACVWWNAEQSYTAECPEGFTGDPVTVTIAEHTYSSELSQALADEAALAAARKQAEMDLTCDEEVEVFFNTQQTASKSAGFLQCGPLPFTPGVITTVATVSAGFFSSIVSQADANENAHNYARNLANALWGQKAAAHQCGTFFITFP